MDILLRLYWVAIVSTTSSVKDDKIVRAACQQPARFLDALQT
jgi:hypothetical protein